MSLKSSTHNHPVVQQIIPFLPLKAQIVKKGFLGKHLSLTGSPRYPGAATFPAMAALKMGVDLTYLLLPPEEQLLLISRMKSNDFMVSSLPFYFEIEKPKIDFKSYTNNMTSIVYGPGLSRITDAAYKYNDAARGFYKKTVLSQLNIILESLNQPYTIPLVIDADGLFLITQNENESKDKEELKWFKEVKSMITEILKIGHNRIILTPNETEYKYLLRTITDKVYNVDSQNNALMCIVKGSTDKIGYLSNSGFEQILECEIEGGLKRCGGLGDALTGCLTSLLGWVEQSNKGAVIGKEVYLQTAFTGCAIMRKASKQAFEKHGISTVAEDVISCIPSARDEILGDFINRTVNIHSIADDKITKI
ncbi:hypothetical protein QEN19_001309 [Hanseniaspora menglaensis]